MSPFDHQNIEKSEFNIKTVVVVVLSVISLIVWMYTNIVIPVKELQITVAEHNSEDDIRLNKLESAVFK